MTLIFSANILRKKVSWIGHQWTQTSIPLSRTLGENVSLQEGKESPVREHSIAESWHRQELVKHPSRSSGSVVEKDCKDEGLERVKLIQLLNRGRAVSVRTPSELEVSTWKPVRIPALTSRASLKVINASMNNSCSVIGYATKPPYKSWHEIEHYAGRRGRTYPNRALLEHIDGEPCDDTLQDVSVISNVITTTSKTEKLLTKLLPPP